MPPPRPSSSGDRSATSTSNSFAATPTTDIRFKPYDLKGSRSGAGSGGAGSGGGSGGAGSGGSSNRQPSRSPLENGNSLLSRGGPSPGVGASPGQQYCQLSQQNFRCYICAGILKFYVSA